jgi:hypothetical protein
MIIDQSNNYLISATGNGTLAVFNMEEGAITVQSAIQSKFNSIAYDRIENVAICGTYVGTVVVLNLCKNPPSLLDTVVLPGKYPNSGNVFVAYNEEMRLLYATHHNDIIIYHWNHTVNKYLIPTVYLTLSLKQNIKINNLLVLNQGLFVIASSTKGFVAVFDISDAPVQETVDEAISNATKNVLSNEKSKQLASASADVDLLTTSTSGLLPWEKVVLKSNSAMRDWLRAKGVDSSLSTTRADLIRLITKISHVSITAVKNVLLPKNPRKDVLFTWNLKPIKKYAIPGEVFVEKKENFILKKLKIGKGSFILNATYIEEMRAILFGCWNGLMHVVSLQDFLPPFLVEERQDINLIRNQMSVENASLKGNNGDNISKNSNIKGSIKSTRGKRHQLSGSF